MTTENIHFQRISELRSMMLSKGWDAVVITGSDPHQSEYPSPRWKQVEWLTGFTGEAGDVVVTADHAGLWTDSRYFIQADRQLEGTGVALHKTRVPEQVLIPEWLCNTFRHNGDAVIAIDPLCFSCDGAAALEENFTLAKVPDLLEPLWKDRPGIPQTPVFQIFTGEDRGAKLSLIREFISENECDALLVSSLDEIAWTLNVRAWDIEYNPFVISYLIVGSDYVRWYVEKAETDDPQTPGVFAALREEGIDILPYDDITLALSEMEEAIIIDPRSANAHLRSLLSCPVKCLQSPIGLLKAVKNEYEVNGMREAHIKDGLAVEKFLFWLEQSLLGGRVLSEREAALELGRLRAEDKDYLADSFETISAYGENAALPHYSTPESGGATIRPRGLYLCDSGAHYRCGTTDITRTVPVGECTEMEARDYTLVLKGHIDLAKALFPEGTPGCRIDALSRAPLWSEGLNFGHGTGHGVGFVLGVHEGPQDIRQNLNPAAMLENMVTSDEPGIYREGLFGIRHENLLLTVAARKTEFGRFLGFEPLTLCHFDTSILDLELLDKTEIEWLNNYNRKVFDTLSPMMEPQMRAWLEEKCKAV